MRTCPRPLTRLNLKKFQRKEWVFVAKEVVKKVKLQIPAGKANPAPPVGTVLGPAGINIQEFCQKFNDATKDKMGDVVPCEISIYEDRRKDWSLTIDKLIQEYEDKVFEFNPNISSDDKAVTIKFSRYISNEDKFEYWRNLYKFLVLSK